MTGVDVVVVGAGAGGPVVARLIAEAGLDVALLDAGPWLDPRRDYTQNEDEMFSMADGRLRWGPGDLNRDPWSRRREGIGVVMQSAGVGGCTRHYNGMAARAPVQSIDDAWPLTYGQLTEAYEAVECLLPVARVRRLAPKDEVFARGCRARGIAERFGPTVDRASWGHSYNAILPEARSNDGPGCTLCGHCLIGCSMPRSAGREEIAKRSTDVSMVPLAVATGRCTVIPNAFAQRIDVRAGTATGVTWRCTDTGAVETLHARAVVMAAGAVETPRLWMNSDLPRGTWVGAGLTCHLPDLVTAFFDEPTHPDVGQATMAKADFPGKGVIWSEGFAPWGFAASLTASGQQFWDEPIADPDEPWDREGRAWGAAAMRQIARYRYAVTLAISTDDEVDVANRVELASQWPHDEHGPVPSIIYRPTPTSVARRDWLAREAAHILRAAGGRDIVRSAPSRAVVAHAMGTMRMSDRPADGVCDARGEAHAVSGLFIADASVLPNGIGGAPPSLTIQSLAWRVGRHVAARLGAPVPLADREALRA